MYFDKNDIDFLKSGEYKKYKKIQHTINYLEFDEVSIFTLVFMIIVIVISLLIGIFIINGNDIPNGEDIIKSFREIGVFKTILFFF